MAVAANLLPRPFFRNNSPPYFPNSWKGQSSSRSSDSRRAELLPQSPPLSSRFPSDKLARGEYRRIQRRYRPGFSPGSLFSPPVPRRRHLKRIKPACIIPSAPRFVNKHRKITGALSHGFAQYPERLFKERLLESKETRCVAPAYIFYQRTKQLYVGGIFASFDHGSQLVT